MKRIVHFVKRSAQSDFQSECGQFGYIWPSDQDREGMVGDPVKGIWFAKPGHEHLINCEACRPAATQAVKEQEAFNQMVEAAGGSDQYVAGILAKVNQRRAERADSARVNR